MAVALVAQEQGRGMSLRDQLTDIDQSVSFTLSFSDSQWKLEFEVDGLPVVKTGSTPHEVLELAMKHGEEGDVP